MEITYGNREGQYFTEWRFDLLKEILNHVHFGPIPGHSQVLDIQNPHIFYDQNQDFHHLTFEAGGKSVNVRLYKVFSVTIDGKNGWIGCPTYQQWEFSNYLRKECGIKPKYD